MGHYSNAGRGPRKLTAADERQRRRAMAKLKGIAKRIMKYHNSRTDPFIFNFQLQLVKVRDPDERPGVVVATIPWGFWYTKTVNGVN
jgi:hypothetical protein